MSSLAFETAEGSARNSDGTLVGLAFSIGVLYALASGNAAPVDAQVLEMAMEHVAEASLPEDSTDVWCIILGESVGVLSSTVLRAGLTSLVVPPSAKLRRMQQHVGQSSSVQAAAKEVANNDTDFKMLQQKMRKEHDISMRVQRQRSPDTNEKQDEISSRVTVTTERRNRVEVVDLPEIFADVIKWLQYDILSTAFDGGTLCLGGHSLSPSSTGVEPLVVGFLSGLSALLYLDVVRLYTRYGPEEKLIEAQTRSIVGWASLYAIECLAAAILFFAYEAAREPISALIAHFA